MKINIFMLHRLYDSFFSKDLQTLRILLQNLRSRGSTFKSMPFSSDKLEKYVNEYLKRMDMLHAKIRSNSQNPPRVDKKAVCGSLNGNF